MSDFKKHLIKRDQHIREALKKLNELALDAILFVTDGHDKLVGSLTDGDIRRGFIRGYEFDTPLVDFMQPAPVFIEQGKYSLQDINSFKQRNLRIIPILDQQNRIVNILNFRTQRSLLPLDAVIMAGGEGMRLRPLTERVPKPLLKVGDKPIIEYNIDRLKLFGVQRIFISVKYLGQQLIDYFGNGEAKGIDIQYIWEGEPLGTIGALSLLQEVKHNNLLVMNSDILTNIDFEDFYQSHVESKAAMSVAAIPYTVKVPYAVLETDGQAIVSFVEKPTYTYYSNGGIYLLDRELLEFVPKNRNYHATDLMQEVIKQGKGLSNYPLLDYWLDIGKHEDFEKAQRDIKHINL